MNPEESCPRAGATAAAGKTRDPLLKVLAAFQNVKSSGQNKWTASCPAHHDEDPSLSIAIGKDGRVLLHCHVGCSIDSICDELGIGKHELFASPARGRHADLRRCNARADWTTKAKFFIAAITVERLSNLATKLGVARSSLKRIGVGWDARGRRHTFPERDGSGRIIGIATRAPNGDKVFMKGGCRGLTIPEGFGRPSADSVLVVEGPSDVAACLTIGLTVIGRPSCKGGVEHLSKLLDDRNVLIVGEFDPKADGTWPGRDGAQAVAKALVERWGHPVKWSLPPDNKKDVRAWLISRDLDLDDSEACKAAGAELLEVLVKAAIEAAPESSKASTPGGDNGAKPTQSAMLVEQATGMELFHKGDAAYVTISIGKHFETHAMRTKAFRLWLSRLFYQAHGKPPNSQAMQDALSILTGKALFDGPELPVAVRIAERDGAIWLDLADAAWQAVRIDTTGWQVVANPPVKFIRPRGVLRLPQPVAGGFVDELKRFVNLPTQADWALLVAWLVASLRPTGPYPVLVISGEQGSAKSTLCRIVRAIVDPNVAPLRAEPREGRDLMIAATNSWVIGLDNLSRIAPWLSDSICRLATGGGFAVRELYSDDAEKLFDAMRPVVINGIEELVTRGDLQDRTITLTLPEIPDERRRPEKELWAEFEAVRPRILGAMLDAVAAALRNLPGVKLSKLPRMADFAMWAVAAEPALGLADGSFMAAYAGNREAAVEVIIESAAIGPPILGLMQSHTKWQGTAQELLANLENRHADDKTRKRRGWPRSPSAMSNALRRLAPSLRKIGIAVTFDRESGRRIITLERGRASPSFPSPPSLIPPRSAGAQISYDGVDADADGERHQRGHAGDTENAVSGSSAGFDDGNDAHVGGDNDLQGCSVSGDGDDWGEV